MIHRLILILISTGLAAACTTPKLRVQSEPTDVEVFISQQNSGEKKSIGKTPLEVPYRELREKVGVAEDTGDFVVLTFDNKEIEPEKLLVPLASYGTKTMTVRVNLAKRQESKNASTILQIMHNAQKFAQANEFERAQIEVDKVLEMDPHFVRAMSLKGSIYYVQKNYPESLKWYEKALTEDAGFDEATKMITKIKQEHP